MADDPDQAAEFTALWRAGATAPDVAAFLAAHPAAAPAAAAEVLLADLWLRYEAGRPRPVEEYLTLAPAVAADPELKLDLVYGDYRAARRFGPPPDPAALAARFPDLAAALARHVAFDSLLTPEYGSPEPTASLESAGGSPAPEPAPVGGPPPGFEYVRELGRGGFGTVWLARHKALDKLVAVKHLRPGRVSGGEELAAEARTMAALKVHPNRVTVFDLVGTDAGWFLVMDYIDGGPLAGLVEPGRPLDWVRAARYVADVADGLAEVHARGVWHRDIKPDNILLDRDRDAAVLTDFGLAAHAAAATGCCGTPGFMAPELLAGAASAKSDVFALAATLCYLATGRKPADDLAAVDVHPAALAAAVRAGLDPDPGRRADLAGFAARLRGCHTAGLADRLRVAAADRPRAVRLAVTVSTAAEADLAFRTVFSGPVPTDGVAVRCAEVVRFEAAADADGYLTVLNLSAGGEVGVLLPNPRVPDNRIRAGQPRRLTVKLTPPAGTDHAVLVWTPGPCPLTAREWRERIESGRLAVAPPADRGMEFVALDTPDPAESDWAAAVVGIEHD
jgi:hypothetical protein